VFDMKELQAKLQALSDDYAAQLPEKLQQLEQAWQQLPQPEWNAEGFADLYRMVHSLSGSGKTFGFAALSDVARTLEDYLKPLAAAQTALSEDQRLHVEVLLRELHQVSLHRDIAPGGQEVVGSSIDKAVRSRRIFIVEDDHAQAEELQIQLSYFGYTVSVFHTQGDFRQAMQANPDVIVLMDINFPEDDRAGVRVMHELQQGREIPIPVIFITSHHEFDVRLDAVRAGGIAYLNKPINISSLIDKLDNLTSSKPQIPYRVLIVDDSPALTSFYANVLEQAGKEVRTINDPLTTLGPLLEFSPDLILIDMYMPQCSGMELAKVIRQLDAFVSIPIVFLSAERDLDKQLSAISLGGDDFLIKPVQPQHLLSAVTSRIRRSHMLRSFMVRDSLTDLLNHTAIKEQLEHELARAARLGKPLSFAMVDIDHFKKVNDTYGHPVGDLVIKSLARLLKQRLRENDLVGRYGGEEFAVVLVDTDGTAAAKVLDSIRQDFAHLRHLGDGAEFSVTFSCGIADVAHFSNAARLNDAADKALYKAKHAGRNQVMLAGTAPNSAT